MKMRREKGLVIRDWNMMNREAGKGGECMEVAVGDCVWHLYLFIVE